MTFDPLYIQPGSLRHSITIQSPSSQRDAAGQPITTWDNVLTTRASIIAASQREQVQGADATSLVTHTVTVRYPGALIRIVSGQRISHGSDIYLIQTVNNVMQRNRVLKLMCLQVDASA